MQAHTFFHRITHFIYHSSKNGSFLWLLLVEYFQVVNKRRHPFDNKRSQIFNQFLLEYWGVCGRTTQDYSQWVCALWAALNKGVERLDDLADIRRILIINLLAIE